MTDKQQALDKMADNARELGIQMQPPPPECQTEAEKTAYAFGWWKALESQRALDKKAENARELGLDYEPARRTWVGLTDEEIEKLTVELRDIPVTLAFAIEAKLKEKNT